LAVAETEGGGGGEKVDVECLPVWRSENAVTHSVGQNGGGVACQNPCRMGNGSEVHSQAL